MSVQDLIDEGVALFKNKKFDKAIEKLNQALDEIEDENSQIQEQINIQFWFGCCYLEQAMKSKGKIATKLFDQAVEHHQQQLRLAEQLEDKQNGLQEQIDARLLLGHCYFKQAMKAKGKESEQLFGQTVEHHQQQLSLAKQLADKQNSLQEQIDAQLLLGSCYSEQAKKAKGKESEKLFGQAVEHLQQQMGLAEQLEDKQNSLQRQIYAKFWLGRCYLEQAKKAKGKESKQLFGQAVEHHQQQLSLAEQLADKQNSIQQQIYAQFELGRCYLKQAVKIKDEDSSKVKELTEKADKYFLF